jgi:hypothetical protein
MNGPKGGTNLVTLYIMLVEPTMVVQDLYLHTGLSEDVPVVKEVSASYRFLVETGRGSESLNA